MLWTFIKDKLEFVCGDVFPKKGDGKKFQMYSSIILSNCWIPGTRQGQSGARYTDKFLSDFDLDLGILVYKILCHCFSSECGCDIFVT